MEESSSKKKQHSPNLNEDCLLEILARVPYKSLCRFKCVSRSWLTLCSNPDLRRKSPQTLSGFFYRSTMAPKYNSCPYRHHFINVSGKGRPMVDPSLSFLFSANYASFEFLDCCNGLILCVCRKMSPWRQHEIEFVVCNPATEKWTVLPNIEAMQGTLTMYLGFDPSVSSHFTVFLLMEFMHVNENGVDDEDMYFYNRIMGVEIYSSETGRWTYKKSEWVDKTRVRGSPGVFFNGSLHVTTYDSSVITVDTKGKTWRKIPTPYYFSFIGIFQGHLYAVRHFENGCKLSIWVLEDYGGERWGLKHTFNVLEWEIFGIHRLPFGACYMPRVIAIHPECSLIFLIWGMQRNLMSYNMDNGKMHEICILGNLCLDPYLPYIPCFLEWGSDEC